MSQSPSSMSSSSSSIESSHSIGNNEGQPNHDENHGDHVGQMLGNVSDDSEEGEGEEAAQQQQHEEVAVAAMDDASSDSPATSSDEEMPMEQRQQKQRDAEGTEVRGEGNNVDAEEDDEGQIGRRKAQLQRNEEEEEDDMDEIFARDDDEMHGIGGEEEGEEGTQSTSQRDAEGEEEQHQRQMDTTLGEDDEEEEGEEEENAGPTRIDMEVARCRANLGEEGPYFVKMPNFLNVVSKKFDPETYEDEVEEDDALDEEGRRTRLKVKVSRLNNGDETKKYDNGNTIRWRIVRDSQWEEKRESNAKIVRWSDGRWANISCPSILGKEIFEIEKQRLMDNNHLYTRQGTALQAQALFREKLIFRPHSTETMTHRKMTMNMAEKTNKAQKVKTKGTHPDGGGKVAGRGASRGAAATDQRTAAHGRTNAGLPGGIRVGRGRRVVGGHKTALPTRAVQRRGGHDGGATGRRSMAGGRGGSSDESAEEEERDRRARKAINEAKIYSDDEEEVGGASVTGQTNGDGAGDDSDAEPTHNTNSSRHQPQQKKKIVIDEDDE
ncbi:hypothetical protein niasHT_000793 [Heterodera trifolii]|uniref:RNA polymerase-associated protein LEO1 n=1 Tax=Heterodera trifolii TaxID=157864 RepID=A0ABD2MA76_9BILA